MHANKFLQSVNLYFCGVMILFVLLIQIFTIYLPPENFIMSSHVYLDIDLFIGLMSSRYLLIFYLFNGGERYLFNTYSCPTYLLMINTRNYNIFIRSPEDNQDPNQTLKPPKIATHGNYDDAKMRGN
jgi:hypothetical protein